MSRRVHSKLILSSKYANKQFRNSSVELHIIYTCKQINLFAYCVYLRNVSVLIKQDSLLKSPTFSCSRANRSLRSSGKLATSGTGNLLIGLSSLNSLVSETEVVTVGLNR